MKVLVACEESQAVCKEFRRLGHEAYSCDILDCSGGHPEWHIKSDVLTQLDAGWDLIIAFPPCTHLACSGAAWFEKKRKDGRQKQGIGFFMEFTEVDCPRVAIENPVGIMSKLWRPPDQKIHPWMFGDPFKKTTCLWLKGLPKLKPLFFDMPLWNVEIKKGEEIVYRSGKKMPKWYADAFRLPPKEREKIRSKTFPGIAKAMAEQWGNLSAKRGM